MLPVIQRRTRRTGQGSFKRKSCEMAIKLACRGYSMTMIREWFASGALKTNKLWWHSMCWMWGGGTLLGEWKLIQASAFWGFLPQMASALKIKCPTLQADVEHLMGNGKQNKVHCFANYFHTMPRGGLGLKTCHFSASVKLLRCVTTKASVSRSVLFAMGQAIP